jgi:hypothetical protein
MRSTLLLVILAAFSSVLVLSCATAALAQNDDWAPMTGANALREFMSGLTAERTLPNGELSRGEYRADGTGILRAWGATIPRTWEIEGDDQLCVTAEGETQCYRLDKSTTVPDLYRARSVTTGAVYEFTVTGRVARALADEKGVPPEAGATGGPAAPSAAEIAKELSNPATLVSSLGNNIEYRKFKGDLPGAGDQESWVYTFQPAFPFPMGDGKILAFRPAFPVLLQQPVFDATTGGFEDKGVELGDIPFDLAYGGTSKGGLITLAGLFGVLPTHTDDAVGSDQWRLGPELVLGVTKKWGVLGGLFSHQWNVGGGSDEPDTSISSLNYFYAFNLGGGLQFASGPTITYDWEADSGNRWTVPLGVGLSKTFIKGGRPIKTQLQLFYNVEQPDAFAQEWGVKLTITPVVKNPFIRK